MGNNLHRLGFWLLSLAATIGVSACGDNGATSETTSSSTLTITGAPASNAAQGTAYYFNANVAGSTSNAVIFSIRNKPDWATFNAATGELSGTPNQAGLFSDIIISASNGKTSATLQPFSIRVTEVIQNKVSATLSWSAPSKNTDGSDFDTPSGFVIHYGTNPNALNKSVAIGSRSTTSYTFTDLSAGLTYYFAVAAVNNVDMEGDHSTITSIVL